MGGSTKTVGGGAASGVANDFSMYLGEALKSGDFGGNVRTGEYIGPQMPGSFNAKALSKYLQGRQNPNNYAQEAISQTTGISGVLNNMLQGKAGDPKNLQQFQTQFDNYNFTPQQVQGQQIQWNPGQQLNLMQGFGQRGFDMNSALQQIMQQNSQQGQVPQNVLNTLAAQDRAGPYTNTPGAQAAAALIERENARQVADLRARFGAQGGGAAAGTGAQYAEALMRAEASPRAALAVNQINQQEQALDLQNRGLNIQGAMGAGDLLLRNLGLNSNNMLQAAQIGGGYDLQSRGLDLQQLGLQANYDTTRAAQSLQAGNADAQLAQNAALANQGAGLQNRQLQQGYALNQQQMLQGDQQFYANLGAQQQGQVLQMISQMLMQTQGLGTPQAQTVYQPGAFEQALGVASGIAGAIGGIRSGAGMMGGGQAQASPMFAPVNTNFQAPTMNWNYQPPNYFGN